MLLSPSVMQHILKGSFGYVDSLREKGLKVTTGNGYIWVGIGTLQLAGLTPDLSPQSIRASVAKAHQAAHRHLDSSS